MVQGRHHLLLKKSEGLTGWRRFKATQIERWINRNVVVSRPTSLLNLSTYHFRRLHRPRNAITRKAWLHLCSAICLQEIGEGCKDANADSANAESHRTKIRFIGLRELSGDGRGEAFLRVARSDTHFYDTYGH